VVTGPGVTRAELKLANRVTGKTDVHMKGRYSKRVLHLEKCTIPGLAAPVSVGGRVSFSGGKDAVRLTVSDGSTTETVRGSLRVTTGAYRWSFKGRKFKNMNLNIRPEKKEAVLRFQRLQISGDMVASGEAKVGYGTFLRGSGTVSLTNLPGAWGPGSRFCHLDYQLDKNVIKLADIQFVLGGARYQGEGQVVFEDRTQVNLVLGQKDLGEILRLEGLARGRKISGRALVNRISVQDLPFQAARYVKGDLRTLVTFNGDITNLDFHAAAYIDRFSFNSVPYQAYFDIYKYTGRWEIRQADLFKMVKQRLREERKYFFRGREIVFDGTVFRFMADVSDMQLMWQTSGTAFGEYNLDTGAGRMEFRDVELEGEAVDDFETVIERKGQVTRFLNTLGNGLRGTISRTKQGQRIDLSYRYRDRDKLQINGETGYPGAELIFISDSFKFGHLNLINRLVEEDRGRSRTFNYRHRGKLYQDCNLFLVLQFEDGRPRLDGRFRSSGQIRFVGLSKLSDSYDIDVMVENNVFTAVGGELQRAVVNYRDCKLVMYGSLDAGDLSTVEEYDLHFKTLGRRGLPIKIIAGGVTMDGRIINGDLKLTGSDFYPEISGTATLDDHTVTFAYLTGEETLPFSQRRRYFFNRVDWDVKIQAGEKTRFQYPLIDCTFEPGSHIFYQGTYYNDEYYLSGTLNTHRGTYTHAGVDFRINRLQAVFPENEFNINPLIDMEGVVRVRDPNSGENVEVTIVKQSRLFSDEGVQFNAAGRGQTEIRELLGWGQDAVDGRKGDTERILSAGTRILGNQVLLRPLERQVRRRLRLDLFHIDTDILSLVNSQTGNPLGFSGGGVSTSLSWGKYLGQRVFLQSDVNFDNIGTSTNTVGGSIGLEYDLQLFNLETRLIMDNFRTGSSEVTVGVKRSRRF
jgi:hypothetical protein